MHSTDALSSVSGQRRTERWLTERAFFDARARGEADAALPIDALALRRYSRAKLRRRFSMEFRFRLLGDLRGKTILDVGCGDGLNAVLFAKLGATVTGLDLSAQAIALARRRAEVNGVADRLRFVCAPIEVAPLAERAFDIVWGDGILHHVLDELPLVLSHLARFAKRDGLLIFAEPLNLCPPLRRVRQLLPVHTEATPGERPLVQAELDLVREVVPDLRVRRYLLFSRLDRFILTRYNYERSSLLRRALSNGIALLDCALLSLPLIRDLAGTCVMWGHPETKEVRP